MLVCGSHGKKHPSTGLLPCPAGGAVQSAPALRGHRGHLSRGRAGRGVHRGRGHRPDHGLCGHERVLGGQRRRHRSSLPALGRREKGRGGPGRVPGNASRRRGGRTHHAPRPFLRRAGCNASRRSARGAGNHRGLYKDHFYVYILHHFHQCYLRYHARHGGYEDSSLLHASREPPPRSGGVSAHLRTSGPARARREGGRDRSGYLREYGRDIPVRALSAQTVYIHNKARGNQVYRDDGQTRAPDPRRPAAPERRFPGVCKDNPALRHDRIRGAPGGAGDRSLFVHAGLRHRRGRRYHGGTEPGRREARGGTTVRIRSKPPGRLSHGRHGPHILFLPLCSASGLHERPRGDTLRHHVHEDRGVRPDTSGHNHGGGRLAPGRR